MQFAIAAKREREKDVDERKKCCGELLVQQVLVLDKKSFGMEIDNGCCRITRLCVLHKTLPNCLGGLYKIHYVRDISLLLKVSKQTRELFFHVIRHIFVIYVYYCLFSIFFCILNHHNVEFLSPAV
jgi:hypothetical protein